jgi:hypothetical protein
MTAAFIEGSEPQSVGEIERMVASGELCRFRAIALAYGLGVRDGKREQLAGEPARVVRVGESGHNPEVQS